MHTVYLNNLRQAPRKVRLVADLISGKRATDALTILSFATKRASHPLAKLIESGIVGAVATYKLAKEDLYVKSIRVDGGSFFKRSMPRARGSAARITRRTSHVALTLGEKESDAKTKKQKPVVTQSPR